MTHTYIEKPRFGLWILTALAIGNMIGSGVFLLPSALAKYGSISIVAWICTSLGALLMALVFGEMSRLIPKVGGPYAYCRESFGNFLGFQIAYIYWISLWVGNAAIAVAMVGYLADFYPVLATNNIARFFAAISAIWFVTLINILGLRQAGIMQLITTILKILPLLAIIIFGIWHIHGHDFITHFNVTNVSNFSALTATAALTLWSFTGLESPTVPAEAVTEPHKTIARATMLGVLITAAIYILSTITVMAIIKLPELANANAPYADAANIIFSHLGGAHWGAMAANIVAIGAVISCLGALNGWTLLQGQVPMAAARDKLFPAIFSYQNRRAAPVVGLVVSSALVSVLLLLQIDKDLVDEFQFIVLLATFAILLPYFFTMMAEMIIMMKYRAHFSKRRLGISIMLAIFASIYAFWAVVGAGQTVIYYGFLLFLSGVPIYVWLRWHHRELE